MEKKCLECGDKILGEWTKNSARTIAENAYNNQTDKGQ